MRTRSLGLAFVAVVLVAGCDEKKPEATAASASAAVSAPPPPAPTPSMTASAAPAESGSATATASSLVSGDANDRIVTVKEPGKDKEVTVKVAAGGAVTLFLPDYSGTVWAFDKADGAIGKPKEEVIPGFAPKTNGHQFKWTGVKSGKSKVTFGNKPAGDKTAKFTQNFTLVVDAS